MPQKDPFRVENVTFLVPYFLFPFPFLCISKKDWVESLYSDSTKKLLPSNSMITWIVTWHNSNLLLLWCAEDFNPRGLEQNLPIGSAVFHVLGVFLTSFRFSCTVKSWKWGVFTDHRVKRGCEGVIWLFLHFLMLIWWAFVSKAASEKGY